MTLGFSNEISQLLVQGLSLTLWLTALTSLTSLVLGVSMGLLRLSGKSVYTRLATIFIEIHRNVPALVLVIFWAFAVPRVFPDSIRGQLFFSNPMINQLEALTGLQVPYYALAAGLGLTLNTAAYLAELFRAGVGTIPQSQLDAARTLGASPWISITRLILPQGIKAAFPAISTRLIHNMKNTALAALVSTPEFFHSVQIAISRSFRATELILLAAGVYLALATLFAAFLKAVERLITPARGHKLKPGTQNAFLQRTG